MISLLFLKLLLAHFLGDFLLQPTKWVLDKEDKKIKSKYLYYHITVHLVLLLIFLLGEPNYFAIVAVVISSHLVIDVLKLYFGNKIKAPYGFFVDQLAHLTVIVLVVAYFETWAWDFSCLPLAKIILFALCLLLTTVVAAVVMKLLISPWKVEDEVALKNAGKYIGILERLFVFGFVMMNFWSGVGFLLAAKSIFRFGDLTRSKDRKLTEYVLIGTLLSFGIAIVCGILFNKLKVFL